MEQKQVNTDHNILIVVPRFVRTVGEFYQFPLGLAYIAAIVKQAGYRVLGLNLNYLETSESEAVQSFVSQQNISIVMSGGLSPFIESIRNIFQGARLANPSVISIAGGGVIGGDPSAALEVLDADFGVVGEGEETIIELLDALTNRQTDFADIPGLVFKDGGSISQTQARKAIRELDSLPFPEFDIFEIERHIDAQNVLDHHFFQNRVDNKPRSIDIITSRSCPFMCTFCFHPVGKTYRERSVDHVIEEIKLYKEKYNINMISILDELFSLRKARLMEFCEKVAPLNLQWMVQLHVRTADDKILLAMKNSGCVYISYGIESVNNDVLESMAKKTTRQEIEIALALTRKHKIGIQGNLIFGDTAETLHTANESLSWWSAHQNYQIYLSKLQVFPGSPDYIMAVRDNLVSSRQQFLKTLPDNFNISNVNNTDASNMFFQLKVHGRTLLRLVPADFNHSQDGLGISWKCPDCNTENNYQGVRLRREHRHFLRLFCRGCHARLDLINQMFDDDKQPSNNALIGGGSTFDNNNTFENSSSNKAISDTALLHQKHSDDSIDSAGSELLDQPFSLKAHFRFAVALEKFGSSLGAYMHFNHVLALSKLVGSKSLELDEHILCKESQDKINVLREGQLVAFLSTSDTSPPFRQSRSNGGYINKNEPDFPEFSLIQVSRKKATA